MKALSTSKYSDQIAISPNNNTSKTNAFSKNKLLSSNPNLGFRVIAKVVSYSNHTLQAIPLEIVK
jgi:hypothetical protein